MDMLGQGDQLTVSSSLIGDLIEVRSDRTLTQIEAYLALQGSHALTWLVYEGDKSQLSLVASIGTTGTGTGFQTSGSLSYALKAGKSYLLAVSVVGSYVAYYSSQTEASLLSFGLADGAYSSSYVPSEVSPYGSSGSLYEFRLTTTP